MFFPKKIIKLIVKRVYLKIYLKSAIRFWFLNGSFICWDTYAHSTERRMFFLHFYKNSFTTQVNFNFQSQFSAKTPFIFFDSICFLKHNFIKKIFLSIITLSCIRETENYEAATKIIILLLIILILSVVSGLKNHFWNANMYLQ